MPRPPQLVEIDPTHLVICRERNGDTKTSLADRAGISLGYLSDLESGRRKGNPGVIKALADALNLPMSMLEKQRVSA